MHADGQIFEPIDQQFEKQKTLNVTHIKTFVSTSAIYSASDILENLSTNFKYRTELYL